MQLCSLLLKRINQLIREALAQGNCKRHPTVGLRIDYQTLARVKQTTTTKLCLFTKILDTSISLTTTLHQTILMLRRTDPPADISRRWTAVGRSCLSYRGTSHSTAPLGFLGSCLTPFMLMEIQTDDSDDSTSSLLQEEIEGSRVCSARAAGGERTVVWKAHPVPEGWYTAQHP